MTRTASAATPYACPPRSAFTCSHGRSSPKIVSAPGSFARIESAVALDGPQHYAFRVVTDRYGVYTATVGTPMPAGAYVLKVASDNGESAQLTLTLGDPSAGALQGCRP